MMSDSITTESKLRKEAVPVDLTLDWGYVDEGTFSARTATVRAPAYL
jgi:hypothetical protein